MKALTRKMLRDLLHMRGQALAICLVMASGVATFVMSLSTLDSLQSTLDAYYERYRFAEVFSHLKRAPQPLTARIREIPGVAQVQTRIVEAVTLDMPGLAEPAVGQLISLADRAADGLNRLYLRSGRLVEPGSEREVIVSEAFADAHRLVPGDTVRAVMNGRFERLRVVGVALSPEFIYQIRPGDILPDDLRFGVFWMHTDDLAAAFDMEGAFNDVALTLMPGADEEAVIDRLDRLTERYGGLGAYGRDDQVSHKYVSNEIKELRGMVAVVPVIFLGVAGFLLNVVLSRLISTQREQIAALKAMGYSRWEIGLHYLQMVLMMVVFSVALGTAVGAWMGSGLTRMYTLFFHFPVFEYELDVSVVLLAFAVSAIAGCVGSVHAARRAVRLPPAEAMRPQPPASFRPTVVERIGLQRLLSPAARMILRQLERQPARAMLSCLGIALAVAILVVGNFMEDAIDYGMGFEFQLVQRGDVTVTFVEPTSPTALAEIRSRPGVQHVEPFRAVSARLRAEHRVRRNAVMGLTPGGELFRLMDIDEKPVPLPGDGLVLSRKLAQLLAVDVGDEITVEVLQETRPVRRVAVVGSVNDFTGTNAYMQFAALNRLMRQEDVMSGAFLSIDREREDALYTWLKNAPGIASVTVKNAALDSFRQTIAETLLRMKTFYVAFAVVIAFGVVYNTARISLSERSRDLATLRVVGFSRGEISLIQLGELAVITVISVPLGLVLGYGLAALTSRAFDTEMFRIPLVVYRSTYGFAAVVITIAAIFSGLVVRRMLDRLDLVAVLKTRE